MIDFCLVLYFIKLIIPNLCTKTFQMFSKVKKKNRIDINFIWFDLAWVRRYQGLIIPKPKSKIF